MRTTLLRFSFLFFFFRATLLIGAIKVFYYLTRNVSQLHPHPHPFTLYIQARLVITTMAKRLLSPYYMAELSTLQSCLILLTTHERGIIILYRGETEV